MKKGFSCITILLMAIGLGFGQTYQGFDWFMGLPREQRAKILQEKSIAQNNAPVVLIAYDIVDNDYEFGRVLRVVLYNNYTAFLKYVDFTIEFYDADGNFVRDPVRKDGRFLGVMNLDFDKMLAPKYIQEYVFEMRDFPTVVSIKNFKLGKYYFFKNLTKGGKDL